MARRAAVALLATVACALAAPAAHAHGDARAEGLDGLVALGPGGRESFELRVHYHRLVGELVPFDASAVSLALYAPDEHRALLAGRAADPLWSSGPQTGRLAFNVAIDCCDDAAYAPFHLVVENADRARGARVALEAKAVHDDFLVGLAGIEGGPLSTLVVFWAPVAVLAVRGRDAGDARAPAAAGVRRLLAVSLATALGSLAVGGALAAWGGARWGVGGMPGLVAATGTLLPPFGPAVFGLLVMAAWIVAGVAWRRAFRLASAAERAAASRVVLAGLALAAALVAVPLALVASYGPRVVPVAPLATAPAALAFVVASARLALTRT